MTPDAIGGSPVRQAIANAAQATGMDFAFLLSTAVRESSLNPRAEARTSSATGLFQFLDQTWLATVKRHGPRHGLANEAALIEIGPDGRAAVADPAMRRMILDLRYDPEVSARMAAEFASDNADFLRARTGMEPQTGDLYAAHFLGAAGASELIMAARDQPWAAAASVFPEAAGANRPIFYDRDGRARSVVEVLENLRRTARQEAPPVSSREMEAGGGFQRWASPDQMGPRINGQLLAASLAGSANDRSLLQLLSTTSSGEDGEGATLALDPAMLAQIYGASDQLNEAAAQQAAQILLSTGSLAQALSPNADREPSRGDTTPGLRGRF